MRQNVLISLIFYRKLVICVQFSAIHNIYHMRFKLQILIKRNLDFIKIDNGPTSVLNEPPPELNITIYFLVPLTN